MGWLIRRLALMAVAGALIAILGGAAWQVYEIVSAGISLAAVPPLTMAMDVMQLHLYAVAGGASGVAVGLLERTWRRLRLRVAGLFQKDDVPAPRTDTDRLIRTERSRRAEAFLSTLEQRSLDNVAITAEGADDGPDVASVITARGGRFTYRVLAYRHLTLEERACVVRDALDHGHVQEPAPGGTATLLTSIGKPSPA